MKKLTNAELILSKASFIGVELLILNLILYLFHSELSVIAFLEKQINISSVLTE